MISVGMESFQEMEQLLDLFVEQLMLAHSGHHHQELILLLDLVVEMMVVVADTDLEQYTQVAFVLVVV